MAGVTAGSGRLYASGNQVATLKDGAVTSRTQWDPNAPLPILATEYDSAWTVKQSYRYDPLAQPAATKTGTGTVFYYHHDTQGSPLAVTSSTGTLHQRWAYDPYGTRVLGTVTTGAPPSTPTYTGARHETTTGNLDLHARQYTPATGRFTSTDPAARGASTPYVSPYAYADNKPTLLTDPSGRTPDNPNDSVDGVGDVLGIFGDAFVDVVKSPSVFLGDAQDAFTGENGGAGAFLDTYLPVRPAYRLYRAEYMLRQQGCDALADLYAEAADELTQQVALVGVGGLTGWRRQAYEPETSVLRSEGLPNSSVGAPLKPLHPDSPLDKSSLDFWHKQSTEEIVRSLRVGRDESLKVKPDGTIMNGNTRIAVLRSRGYDVDSLPRDPYGGRPMTDEDFWDMDQ
ncbi:RHS repeat-associated core domain-containing protein [Streptomyces sp. NPDC057429]|uniref:RHS repeat-associated core domain-containing protein n=1 Tax=Streptomyces sp. NPDC057429 TaxID=3346130 RepID=UPI003681C78D